MAITANIFMIHLIFIVNLAKQKYLLDLLLTGAQKAHLLSAAPLILCRLNPNCIYVCKPFGGLNAQSNQKNFWSNFQYSTFLDLA